MIMSRENSYLNEQLLASQLMQTIPNQSSIKNLKEFFDTDLSAAGLWFQSRWKFGKEQKTFSGAKCGHTHI